MTSENAPVGRPIEVELKYRPTSTAVGGRVLAADDLAGFTSGTPIRELRFEDRYLDTTGGALARAGFAARLRTTDAGTIVSVKSTANLAPDDGGPHRREELEGPADPAAVPAGWPASDARSLVLELAGDAPLVELLTIRQLRRRRVLRDDLASVELSLDDVEVVTDGRVVDRWLELEIELVDGDERRLLDVAAALDADPELAPSRTSKLEAALAAVNGVPAEPAPAAEPGVVRSPGVLGDDLVAEAGRKVLRFHFARMLAREPGTRAGVIDDLHRMRVATRRMRAAWRIFGPGFDRRRTRRLRRRLRRVAGRLGAVRDLDVLLDGLGAYRVELPSGEQAALEPLVAAWQSDREQARGRLAQELESDGYRRFVEEMRAFVEAEGMAVREAHPTAPHHVRDSAPSWIWRDYEQVRAYEPVVHRADVETLHELRIAAKWLRYGIEFVREPLGADAEALIPRVVALQDHLGLLHDADVAAAAAQRLLADRSGALGPVEAAAIDRYRLSREREVGRLRRTVGRPWRIVAGPAFRRRLGQAVAIL